MNIPILGLSLTRISDTPAPSAGSTPAAPDHDIRYLGDMQRLSLKSGDRLVLILSQHLPEAAIRRMEAQLSEFAGGAKVLVLDPGMRIAAFGYDDEDDE